MLLIFRLILPISGLSRLLKAHQGPMGTQTNIVCVVLVVIYLFQASCGLKRNTLARMRVRAGWGFFWAWPREYSDHLTAVIQ
jgi:hypothetical protein